MPQRRATRSPERLFHSTATTSKREQHVDRLDDEIAHHGQRLFDRRRIAEGETSQMVRRPPPIPLAALALAGAPHPFLDPAANVDSAFDSDPAQMPCSQPAGHAHVAEHQQRFAAERGGDLILIAHGADFLQRPVDGAFDVPGRKTLRCANIDQHRGRALFAKQPLRLLRRRGRNAAKQGPISDQRDRSPNENQRGDDNRGSRRAKHGCNRLPARRVSGTRRVPSVFRTVMPDHHRTRREPHTDHVSDILTMAAFLHSTTSFLCQRTHSPSSMPAFSGLHRMYSRSIRNCSSRRTR